MTTPLMPARRRWLPASWQGEWTPVRLRLGDVTVILWALTFQAGTRGVDYLTGAEGDEKVPKALAAVEEAAPLWAWGAVFLLGAIVLGCGMLLLRHSMVWAGHSILTIAYGALSIGLLSQALMNPWADGIRSATVLLTMTVVHALAWWRTGPRPPKVPARVQEWRTSC